MGCAVGHYEIRPEYLCSIDISRNNGFVYTLFRFW